jgi:hypothetical protein
MGGGPHPPMEVALTWKGNYKNPETRGQVGIVVQEAVLMSLCVIVVILRVYTRKFLAKNFGLDDVLIILALVCDISGHSTDGQIADMTPLRYHSQAFQRF